MRHRPLAALVLALPLLARAADAPPASPHLRLGEEVRPTGYEVALELDPGADTFTGHVEIGVELAHPSSTIWLNATELSISEAIVVAGGERRKARTVEGEKGFVALQLDAPVDAGAATLELAFGGKVAEKEWVGIFRQEEQGTHYLYSHFEALDARRAFPCFDQPSFKVPWRLALTVPRGMTALSNTGMASSSVLADGRSRVVFERTPPLPSYLVAFAVGPFEIVEAGRWGRKKTPVRIATLKGRAAEARFAVESTGPLLVIAEDYFDAPYAYPKLDLIALPRFLGAMENPGLITFASRLLLATPERETPRHRRVYASICAHELAHLWFGDLVTLGWWDDAWLNEAFASWMGAKMVDRYRPEWRGKVEMAADRVGSMNGDTLVSARRIRQPITSEDDVVDAFDSITYRKGASVLEMFEGWLGEETFRKGVRGYVAAHAHGNADAPAFLKALSEAAGRDVATPFTTFLDQPGIPMVTLTKSCAGTPAMALDQERYLPVGAAPQPPSSWQIPVCAVLDGEHPAHRCDLLTDRHQEVKLDPDNGCPARIDGNAGGRGYYLVRREPAEVAALLASRDLAPHERVGLLAETALLARGGRFPLGDALAIAARLAGDADYYVASEVIGIARSPWPHLLGGDLLPAWQAYVRKTFGARARELGLSAKEGESEEARLLRPELLGLVLLAEEPELVAEAQRRARLWLAERKGLDDDLVDVALDALVRPGDAKLFDEIRAQAIAAKDDRERRRLLSALMSFRDAALLKRALSLMLSDDLEPPQTSRILYAAPEDARTAEILMEFVRAHHDELVARMPRDWGAGLPNAAEGFCDAARLREVEEFFGPRAGAFLGGARNLKEVVESIGLCAAWKEAQSASVRSYLSGAGAP